MNDSFNVYVVEAGVHPVAVGAFPDMESARKELDGSLIRAVIRNWEDRCGIKISGRLNVRLATEAEVAQWINDISAAMRGYPKIADFRSILFFDPGEFLNLDRAALCVDVLAKAIQEMRGLGADEKIIMAQLRVALAELERA